MPSPCTGGKGTGTWSEHAYGEAVDLNPVENPYVGCGPATPRLPYLDRSRLRPGMVTPAVVEAFRSIGWGWGGAWTGSTRDYMAWPATCQLPPSGGSFRETNSPSTPLLDLRAHGIARPGGPARVPRRRRPRRPSSSADAYR